MQSLSLACLFKSSGCYCSQPDVSIGIDVGVGVTHLTLLHLEWPKLYGVLAVLSAVGLSFRTKFFYVVGKALLEELSCMQRGLVFLSHLVFLVSGE